MAYWHFGMGEYSDGGVLYCLDYHNLRKPCFPESMCVVTLVLLLGGLPLQWINRLWTLILIALLSSTEGRCMMDGHVQSVAMVGWELGEKGG